MPDLENRHHLLGPKNETSFGYVEGTPPFSAYIADLALQKVLQDKPERNKIWDPYCGNGVILRTCAVLHRPQVERLYASDIRKTAVDQTSLNLLACSLEHYQVQDSFTALLKQYGCTTQVPFTAFTHNALSSDALIQDDSIDVLLTDPPYEYFESYIEDQSNDVVDMDSYLQQLLASLRGKLRDDAIIGLILESSRDYEDVLADSLGYEFGDRDLVHPAYKNRTLYTLNSQE